MKNACWPRSAETLLGGLGGEKDRWSENAVVLNDSLVNVVGDVLLAGGCVAYLGCFTVDVSVKNDATASRVCTRVCRRRDGGQTINLNVSRKHTHTHVIASLCAPAHECIRQRFRAVPTPPHLPSPFPPHKHGAHKSHWSCRRACACSPPLKCHHNIAREQHTHTHCIDAFDTHIQPYKLCGCEQMARCENKSTHKTPSKHRAPPTRHTNNIKGG